MTTDALPQRFASAAEYAAWANRRGEPGVPAVEAACMHDEHREHVYITGEGEVLCWICSPPPEPKGGRK